MKHERDNYDSPWKEAIEHWFERFMEFFFPDIHALIDWDKGYEFLDTELNKITRDAQVGYRFADKLIRVFLYSGEEALICVFIHIEVQGQRESDFPKRIFVYHYRIFDYTNGQVVSLAVLADEDAGWRPDRYTHEQWGCSVTFIFPTVKLLDYRNNWEALEQSTNPFATVVMAHLKTQETRHKEVERKQWKIALLNHLYRKEYRREDILELLRFLDWIMWLPEELQHEFVQEWKVCEEANRMQYMMSFERAAKEEGILLGRKEGLEEGLEKGLRQGIERGWQEGARKGLLDGIALALELKFGDEASSLFAAISPTVTLPHLRAIHQTIRTARSSDELRAVILNPPDEGEGGSTVDNPDERIGTA